MPEDTEPTKMLAPPYHDPLTTEEWLESRDINYERFLEEWKRLGLDNPKPAPDQEAAVKRFWDPMTAGPVARKFHADTQDKFGSVSRDAGLQALFKPGTILRLSCAKIEPKLP